MKLVLALLVLAAWNFKAGAEVLSSNKWKEVIQSDLQKVGCGKDSYFVKCFAVTISDCEKAIMTNFNTCATKATLPKKIDTQKDGPRFASEVGKCTGLNVEKNLQKQNPLPKECNDIRSWL